AHVFIAHTRSVQTLLTNHYRRVIPVFGDMALKQVKSRNIQKKSATDLFATLAEDWIRRESTRKAKYIADTDRDEVIDAISDGLRDGDGVAAIAKNIRSVSQLTPYRAALVARTETHAAATYGSVESVRSAERDLGVTMLKEWLPTLDDRTRPAHAAMAGSEPIPLDDKFIVDGEMMDRPGDPSASPANLCNCRCGLIYSEAN
ncbi:phage minor head protein, partial [Zavarzinella formosa]|uniref:phage minor head protein n=1 Tax=Zavarzinella formosa TaxID=360055 RepID=UPI000594AA26